jgi:hypothetical protein
MAHVFAEITAGYVVAFCLVRGYYFVRSVI